MSSAIRNFLLKKKDENCDLHDKRNWDTLDEDKKLPQLLHELYDSMIIQATPVNQQQRPPQEHPPQEQSPQEQPSHAGAATTGAATTAAATTGAAITSALKSCSKEFPFPHRCSEGCQCVGGVR